MAFYILQHGWYMQSNSVVAPFNVFATSRSCGNIRCFDQNYQPGKITLQVSVLIFKYLCLLDKVTCAVFLAFEKWYGCLVKALII